VKTFLFSLTAFFLKLSLLNDYLRFRVYSVGLTEAVEFRNYPLLAILSYTSVDICSIKSLQDKSVKTVCCFEHFLYILIIYVGRASFLSRNVSLIIQIGRGLFLFSGAMFQSFIHIDQ